MNAVTPAPARWAVLGAFAAVYLIWGSTYLAIRISIETLPPFLMAGVRFVVAGTVLYAWLRLRGARAPERRHWTAATISGGLMLLGGNGGVVWAEQYVPSGLAALIVATVPLWMVLMDWLRPGGERPSRPIFLGLLVGLAGVAVLVGPEESAAEGVVPWLPALALLGASASWSAGSLYARRSELPSTPLLGTALQMLGGGALLTLVGLLRGEVATVDPAAWSVRSLVALGYLIAFGSLVGFTCYVWLLKVSTPAKAATYAYVNPIVAVVLGWALVDEPLNWRVGLAAGLVVGAVALVTTTRAGARREPEEPTVPAPPTEPEPCCEPEMPAARG